ncbi:MAG: hypothetical protein HY880_00470 [Deltaproteobacteria bacterium]|nr:hypothetical protein [Deltaproteobacteria bacterium]
MKKQSKNLISLMAVLAVLCIGYPAVSFGAPAHNVKSTKHNMSTSRKDFAVGGNWKSGGANPETQVCVFCHTPHNSVAGKPFIWNRINDKVPSFQLYTGSPTLDFTNTPPDLSEISKMCMTCHDGATSLNTMANPRNITMASDDQLGDLYWGEEAGLGWGPNIGNALLQSPPSPSPNNDPIQSGGGNLINDHTVSFVYEESCNNDPTGIKKPGADCSGSSIGGLPLWLSGDGGFSGYKVECVTCHDPHINYDSDFGGDPAYKPFLRKTVSSSSLCFTCHNK